MRRLRASIVLAALLACASLAQAQLPAPVVKALAAGAIPDDALSALVLRGDATLLSHLAERQMQPASIIKLVTTMSALDQLGPVFRSRTELRTNARRVGALLQGDVYLRGGADTDLDTAALEQMLRTLHNDGIRSISGRLVLDRTLFNPPRSEVGAPIFDEWPDAYYNVIPDALMVNENILQLDLRSSASGVQVQFQPALDGVNVVSGMTLIDANCARWEDGWKQSVTRRTGDGLSASITLVLQGTFPRNCKAANNINALDRNEYVGRLLRALWKRMGGTISGGTVDGVTPADAHMLAHHISRTLPETIRDTNKPSDNALARTVFLSLGSLEPDNALGSRPIPGASGENTSENTTVRADAAVRRWMRERGIDDAGMVLENGAGLSRIERISAVQLGGVLQAGLRSKWAPEFQASLPIAAVDGTMGRRLKDSPAAGRARMKTGSIKDVIGVAGYVLDASGQQCVVVAIINHEASGEGRGRAVLDALIDWVARSTP